MTARPPLPATEPAPLIRVLVVDDSAVMRRFMSTLLDQEAGMVVESAADPLIAMRKMEGNRPDVILLDLEMPHMNGLTFLRKIMRGDPVPVVICSSHAGRGTDTALRALEEGAVEVIAKPEVGITEFLHESAVLLIDTLRAASQAQVSRSKNLRFTPSQPLTADAVLPPSSSLQPGRAGADPVIAIGASTGGPDALAEVLAALPVDTPAGVIVQHMPKAFTAAFANRLNGICHLEVKEAVQGDLLKRGRFLIAPGDQHMAVQVRGENLQIKLIDGPLVSRHRPSVDVLFRSVAQAAGANAIGVILTGMGNDGAAGLLEMRQAGATALVQDAATSVVFGMAKEAYARDAVDCQLPLGAVAQEILRRVAEKARISHPVRSAPLS